MKRILIIGGYGGFGARLSRRLSEAGHHLLVAGRSLDKAMAFAASLPSAEPLVADRTGDVASVFAQHRPDIVIDAAGPFQGSDYRVPEACIAAGAHYLDLADARDFVCGIGALDERAKTAGATIISGASTLPGLSGAVVRHLTDGLETVRSVDMSLSAFNKSTANDSVARAILSYAGRPIRLWRGGGWRQVIGWHEMQRIDFAAGDRSIRNRWVALSDVPDLELMPATLPGQPSVVFRAGNDVKVQMAALWAMSWLARWAVVRSLLTLAPIILPVQRALRWMGGDRSAMKISVAGERGGQSVERRWTIIAHSGDGPEIPTMAAELLVEDLVAGRLWHGAYNASGLLSLDRFEPLFESLDIRWQID